MGTFQLSIESMNKRGANALHTEQGRLEVDIRETGARLLELQDLARKEGLGPQAYGDIAAEIAELQTEILEIQAQLDSVLAQLADLDT